MLETHASTYTQVPNKGAEERRATRTRSVIALGSRFREGGEMVEAPYPRGAPLQQRATSP